MVCVVAGLWFWAYEITIAASTPTPSTTASPIPRMRLTCPPSLSANSGECSLSDGLRRAVSPPSLDRLVGAGLTLAIPVQAAHERCGQPLQGPPPARHRHFGHDVQLAFRPRVAHPHRRRRPR